jgi:cyclophilin family peptidyl-prolyl cis-trans isomerase
VSRRVLCIVLSLVLPLVACGPTASQTAPTPTRVVPPTPASSSAQVSGGLTAVPKLAASPSPSPSASASPVAQGVTVATNAKQFNAPPTMSIDPKKRYTATIDTSMGSMKADLFAEEAPITVNNFVFLARQAYYDGSPFHRIIKDFMVQTGDPVNRNGTGGPGYRFQDEPVKRSYERGTLAMANAGPNTNGSQFFIVHGGSVQLPPNYTIFGKLTDGLDTLDKIANVAVGASAGGERSKPQSEITITTVKIDES